MSHPRLGYMAVNRKSFSFEQNKQFDEIMVRLKGVVNNYDDEVALLTFYRANDSSVCCKSIFRLIVCSLGDSADFVVIFRTSSHSSLQIILQSMHKYKPRVHIIQHDPRVDLSQIHSLPAEGVHSFSFPETEFTTVTAYQNQQVPPTDPLWHKDEQKKNIITNSSWSVSTH